MNSVLTASRCINYCVSVLKLVCVRLITNACCLYRAAVQDCIQCQPIGVDILALQSEMLLGKTVKHEHLLTSVDGHNKIH